MAYSRKTRVLTPLTTLTNACHLPFCPKPAYFAYIAYKNEKQYYFTLKWWHCIVKLEFLPRLQLLPTQPIYLFAQKTAYFAYIAYKNQKQY